MQDCYNLYNISRVFSNMFLGQTCNNFPGESHIIIYFYYQDANCQCVIFKIKDRFSQNIELILINIDQSTLGHPRACLACILWIIQQS